MATYVDMQNRIAREIHRSDLTADIKTHILSAITFYSSMRTNGNEKMFPTVTTIKGTKYYSTTTTAPGTLPSDIIEIDSITTTVNTRIYQLTQASFSDLEKIDVGNTTLSGYPRLWAWYAGQLRLYPTPNGAYALSISGQSVLTALVADGDSNFWTNDGEILIRQHAKKTIAMDLTYDNEMASRCAALEKEALVNIKAETNQLISSGRLRSTSF